MSIEKRITLTDIARVAGVHHTTVSMALRNRPELPLATRERIREIADKMGYRPDPVLGALRAYRHKRRTRSGRDVTTGSPEGLAADGDGDSLVQGPTELARKTGLTMAFVTAFDTPDFWRKIPAYERRFVGVEKRAAQLGYGIEHFWFDRASMTGRRATQILRARNVAGVIVAPIKLPSMLDLDWGCFACVSLTFSVQQVEMHVVCNNHLDTVRLAWRSLLERGCRKPGLVLEDVSDERVLRIWSTGALGEAARLPSQRRVPCLIPKVLTKTVFLEWVERHKPDAILTISPHMELLDWLRESGRQVPQDIAFANLDCPEPNGAISGVYQSPELLGMTSVDVLSGLLQRNDLGLPEHPQSILMRGVWIDRKTTRGIAAAESKTRR